VLCLPRWLNRITKNTNLPCKIPKQSKELCKCGSFYQFILYGCRLITTVCLNDQAVRIACVGTVTSLLWNGTEKVSRRQTCENHPETCGSILTGKYCVFFGMISSFGFALVLIGVLSFAFQNAARMQTVPFELRPRLPDVLERQELSLNLLSKLVMSLILENILLALNIFRRPWKFLNSFQTVHFWTIHYIEHSRIKNKQCKWTEQCVDLFQQLCSKSKLFKNGCVVWIRFV